MIKTYLERMNHEIILSIIVGMATVAGAVYNYISFLEEMTLF